MRRLPKNILFFGVGLSLIIPKVFACGLEWAVPVTHFDGVEEHGYVCISEKIGEVDFGDDLKLPLIINFRSDRNTSSPYLGKGWILALLDSNFVQFDENTFYMTQPDGWINRFQRDPKNPTLLGGSAGWKAEIKGDTITAWAACGWKIVFRNGKINSLSTPKNRKLDFVYNGNKVIGIREGGATKLMVEYDPHTDEANALVANEKRVTIYQGQRPRVEYIASQNILGGMDRSLYKLESASDTSLFEFATNDKMQPTLCVSKKDSLINSSRLIAWDTESKKIIQDKDWIYRVTPTENVNEYAAIGRTNNNKQSEFWHYDFAKGEEITRNISGIERITSWHVSGKLRNKIRYITENGIIQYGYSYDEQGRLIRVVSPRNKNIHIDYSSKNILTDLKTQIKNISTLTK